MRLDTAGCHHEYQERLIRMKNIFTKHPHEMDETYFEHMRCALSFSAKMLTGGIACLIHAFFPFWFKKTGSDFLFRMTHDYVERSPEGEGRVEKLSQLLEMKIHRCGK